MPLAAQGMLALQRTVGNRAATALLQRQLILAAPPTRPTVETGDIDQAVGVLQQKLNVLGENLVIDAEFGGRTRAAVVRFQRAHPPLMPNGVADADPRRRSTRSSRAGSFSPTGRCHPSSRTARRTRPVARFLTPTASRCFVSARRGSP